MLLKNKIYLFTLIIIFKRIFYIPARKYSRTRRGYKEEKERKKERKKEVKKDGAREERKGESLLKRETLKNTESALKSDKTITCRTFHWSKLFQ